MIVKPHRYTVLQAVNEFNKEDNQQSNKTTIWTDYKYSRDIRPIDKIPDWDKNKTMWQGKTRYVRCDRVKLVIWVPREQ